MMQYDVIIIGAGVAGVFAATSSLNNKKTLLIDKNHEILNKFMITGKGKSNIANTLSPHEFINNLIEANKFLYPALYQYNGNSILKLLDDLKIKYFFKEPHRVHLLDTNSSFRRKMLKIIKEKGIDLVLNTNVVDIKKENELFVIITDKDQFIAKHLIIATGGLSYKNLGSSGDGYLFAKKFDINVKPFYPIGVGIHTDIFKKGLQGISVDEVDISVFWNNKKIYSEKGSMMFTHYGIGGPVVRRVSGYVSKALMNKTSCHLEICFVQKDIIEQEIKQKHYLNELFAFLKKDIKKVLLESFNKNDLKNLNKQEINQLIEIFSAFKIYVKNTESIDFAINTGGGIDLQEIDPNSYQSKKIDNLFFIGEVLDLNPRTNGFNITTCFATANKCMEYINKVKEKK